MNGNANDRFSRACSAMIRIGRGENEGYNDIAIFRAPRECNGDVRRWAEREAMNELARIGYADPVEFVVELHRRADGKQVYEMGLDAALPESVQWAGYDRWQEIKEATNA